MFFVLFFLLFSIEKINTIDDRRWKVEGRKLKVEAGGLKVIDYIQLGFLYGLAVSVKLNSGPLGILLVILFAKEYYRPTHPLRPLSRGECGVCFKSAVFILSALSVFVGVYYIHISLGKTVMDKRYYEASGQYKKLLAKRVTRNVQRITFNFENFPFMLKEHLQ